MDLQKYVWNINHQQSELKNLTKFEENPKSWRPFASKVTSLSADAMDMWLEYVDDILEPSRPLFVQSILRVLAFYVKVSWNSRLKTL